MWLKRGAVLNDVFLPFDTLVNRAHPFSNRIQHHNTITTLSRTHEPLFIPPHCNPPNLSLSHAAAVVMHILANKTLQPLRWSSNVKATEHLQPTPPLYRPRVKCLNVHYD